MIIDILTSIISSVLGGLVGGLFTYLGVRATIKHENEKIQKEEERRQKEKRDLQYQQRPRFEIIEHSEIIKYSNEMYSDLAMILAEIQDFKDNRFYYAPELIDTDKWTCVEYTLKNIGATEINCLRFSTNLTKYTALFDVKKDDHKDYYRYNILNCSVTLDKNIKPQETIRVKICYCGEKPIESYTGGASITIWITDMNGEWWSQALCAPHNKINNAIRASSEEWEKHTDVFKIRDCFNNPKLW